MLNRFSVLDPDGQLVGVLQTQLTEDEVLELMDECKDTDEEGYSDVYNFNGLLCACKKRDIQAKEIATQAIYF